MINRVSASFLFGQHGVWDLLSISFVCANCYVNKILFLKLNNTEHKTESHLTTPSSSVAFILGQSIQLKKKFNIRNIFMAMKTLASEKKRSTSISLYKKLFLKACWCSANLRAVAFKPSLFFGIKFSPRFC